MSILDKIAFVLQMTNKSGVGDLLWTRMIFGLSAVRFLGRRVLIELISVIIPIQNPAMNRDKV